MEEIRDVYDIILPQIYGGGFETWGDIFALIRSNFDLPHKQWYDLCLEIMNMWKFDSARRLCGWF